MTQKVKKIVLLVEDNPDDLELTLDAFRQHEMDDQIQVVRDGQEALDCLFGEGDYEQQGAFCPKLTLLDLNLPKLSGLQVLKRLRQDQRTRVLPVVVLTSSSQEEDRLISYNLGANGYVRKPVSYEAFMGAVKALRLYWLGLNELPGEGIGE
ncbi:MAG: response regulator [Candidatus Sedimenticola sp. (ex Thyasira tokunagai)]